MQHSKISNFPHLISTSSLVRTRVDFFPILSWREKNEALIRVQLSASFSANNSTLLRKEKKWWQWRIWLLFSHTSLRLVNSLRTGERIDSQANWQTQWTERSEIYFNSVFVFPSSLPLKALLSHQINILHVLHTLIPDNRAHCSSIFILNFTFLCSQFQDDGGVNVENNSKLRIDRLVSCSREFHSTWTCTINSSRSKTKKYSELGKFLVRKVWNGSRAPTTAYYMCEWFEIFLRFLQLIITSMHSVDPPRIPFNSYFSDNSHYKLERCLNTSKYVKIIAKLVSMCRIMH